MPYQHILKDLVDGTPGAVSAILVDWEGEAVQEYCHDDPYCIRFIAAHKGIILNRFKEIHVAGWGGEIEELVVTARDAHLIIGCIDRDYSLVMRVDRDCPVVLALRRFRIALGELRGLV
jgi:predicted regulator of Ras-like GTPase activity (Roadblock/LC7/MglB family)